MIIRFFIYGASLLFVASCCDSGNSTQREIKKIVDDHSFIQHTVKVDSNNDTSDIEVLFKGNILRVHYYKNKPQFILYDNDSIFTNGGKVDEFTKNSKGLYLSLNDPDQQRLTFGVKYFYNNNGVDVFMKSNKKGIDSFNYWYNYTNTGYRIIIDSNLKLSTSVQFIK